MSNSLQLSKEGIKIAQEAFRCKYSSQETLADKLSEVYQCTVTRQPIGRFLKGQSISRQIFVWICEELDIDVNKVVKPLSEPESETTTIDYWQKVCRNMLEDQKQNLRRQVTQMGFELNVYVPLGLVDRKHQPRRSSDFSLSPEQGSDFFQLDKEEIIETYEHDEFLEQVIKQGQSKKSQGKRIAIIGEPGAGKTTLLEAIAFSPLTPGFPIWISLGSLGEKSLEEYLRQKWLKDALKTSDVTQQQKALEELFKSGEVLLLLDGVDEMPAPSPVQALAKIREELTGWVADARVVLTCRVNVWDANHNALQGFDTYRTLEFSYGDGNKPDQVKQFICQWFSNTDKPDLGEPLREKLDEDRHQRIRDLVKNPMRLSLLCQSWYFRQGDLPETKAMLYEQFREAFYEWKKESLPTGLTEREELNAALGRLAREAIDQEKSRFGIQRDFALKVMGEDLFKLATEKLNWLVEIYKDVETGKPIYAFFHPTFQEYFAACGISDWDYLLPCKHNNCNPKPVSDRYRIFEPQWKEVFLLWLGRKDLEEQEKEALIAKMGLFEDGCGKIYQYRAYFLAAAGLAEFEECSFAYRIVDWLVARGFGYFNVEQQKWVYFLDLMAGAARTALLETDRSLAVTALIDLIRNPTNNEKYILGMAAWGLGQIGIGSSEAIETLITLIRISHDATQYKYDSIHLQAIESLGKIGMGNKAAISVLLNLIYTGIDNSIRVRAAESLGKIAPSHKSEAAKTLIDLMRPERGDSIRCRAAYSLVQIAPEYSQEAINTLIELVHSPDGFASRSAVHYLKEISPDHPEVSVACHLVEITADYPESIRELSDLIRNNSDTLTRYQVADKLVKNVKSDQLESVVSDLKDCLSQQVYENDYVLYDNCYKIIWHCAQDISYPDFYQAWHGEPSSIPALENQVTDISSQVQPADKTYPIAIDTQSLKLETNISAIAQKLCTKIHCKAGYFDIPPVSDAAQLQQYIPRIQEKLQKPNLALILHGCEPNEHLINFCYSFADPDIGIYIGLITSTPLEQPLKGFLPNQPNLLSAIQSWISEIG
jgi:HEAT repeat protein